MKKIVLTASLCVFFGLSSCKKDNQKSSSNTSNPVVSTNDINFTSTGTALGKIGSGISDVEGNQYKTVVIGTQEWMAENLKTTKYNDGSKITNITEAVKWGDDTLGAWCYYNNDATNNTKYGKLYNWYAVSPTKNGGKNVCPTGWHLPTADEWNVLTEYLGGDTIAGNKMKEVGTTSWKITNNKITNASLFTGLPGGVRNNEGNFFEFGTMGTWWTSDEYFTGFAFYNTMQITDSQLTSLFIFEKNGLSVRCLKD